MTARATGWDVLSSRLVKTPSSSSPRTLVEVGVKDVEETLERERKLAFGEAEAEGEGGSEGELRERTRWNLRKALRYRSSEDVKRFGDKVQEHMDTLLARPVAVKALREHSEREKERERESGESDHQEYFRSIKDYKLKAGETVPGASGSALRRAQADLGWVPGRKVRWFERRKLGIDRPLTWEQV